MLGVVAPAVVELGRGRVGVAGGTLDIFQVAAVPQGGCDERGSHRLGRVPAGQADPAGILLHDTVDGILVQVPPGVAERAKRTDRGLESGGLCGLGFPFDRDEANLNALVERGGDASEHRKRVTLVIGVFKARDDRGGRPHELG